MYAFVGSFTTARRKARGKGISVYRIDKSSGAWSLVEVFEAIANPGYVALDSQQRFLYASHGDGDMVSAYAIDAQTRKLTFLNQQPSSGDNGPHVMVAPGDRYTYEYGVSRICSHNARSIGSSRPKGLRLLSISTC